MCCLYFFVAGAAFLPHLGIEDDEALFAEAIYHPRSELFAVHIGRSHIPVMLMSYLGTLKALIYKPIFLVWGTGIRTLRTPMLLAGAISLWLFFLLLRRIAGDRAALIGCGLLAVDSMYLLTVCFDWGPVALQHLLLLGGALLLVRFYQQGEHGALAGGFFLFGLAMWDKALAVWLLSGMAVATLLILPRQVFTRITGRRIVIAVLAFAIGAFPLLIYNAENHWVTFRGNFQRDPNGIGGKARLLFNTASGPGLFGWLTNEDWQTPVPHRPEGALESTSARISAIAGHPRQGLLAYAFALALLVTPLARGNSLRAILFALITMAVAWVQMAITANTGGSVHHTILLWPLPELIVAVAFAAVADRLGRAGMTAVAAVVIGMMASGALVINEYYTMMRRCGGAQSWNQAIFRLADYARESTAKTLYCLDWGIMDQLRLLGAGKIPVAMGSDPVSKPEISPDDRAMALRMIAEPESIYICHTKDFEFFPGNSTRLIQLAAESGYRRDVMASISDPYGRQVYEVYRFSKPE